MDRLIYGKSYQLIVTKRLIAEKEITDFRSFLTEENFLFNSKVGNEHIYFHVKCDSLTDGAKIETFLQSPK